MSWTKKDYILFKIVNDFGKEFLETQIQRNSEIFFKLKHQPDLFLIIGYTDLIKNTFNWKNDMNYVSYDFVKNMYKELFTSDELLYKLFTPVVKLDSQNINIIPYLLEALNPQLNVIQYKSKNHCIFILTKLENVEKMFNMDKFRTALSVYNNYNTYYTDSIYNSHINNLSRSIVKNITKCGKYRKDEKRDLFIVECKENII